MKDIRHATAYTESQIMDAVFNAARGNELRMTYFAKGLGKLKLNVRFVCEVSNNTEFKAIVSDSNGFEVGYAIVDEMDV